VLTVSYWRDMLRDEQGSPSMGRLLVTGALVFVGWFTVADIRGADVGQTIYDFWAPIVLTLIAWAAGPRIAQYIAPAAVAAANRVRGVFSSYREREVEQTTVGNDPTQNGNDDPVPEHPEVR
jgi:hypothetical protein